MVPGVVRWCSISSGAGGIVSASVLDDVETAANEYLSFLEGEQSASESHSVVTPSLVESVLDAEPSGVPSTADPVLSVGASMSLSVDLNALRPEIERLSVPFSSAKPVNIRVQTTASVVEGNENTPAGSGDLFFHIERLFCVLKEFFDLVKPCVLCSFLGI